MLSKKKIIKHKNKIIGFALIVFIAIVISPLVYFMNTGGVDCDTIYLEDGWTVKAHQTTYNDVVINSTVFDIFNKGDRLILSRKMPDTTIENAVLEVYSVHSIVNIYLDNELIYSYGEEYASQGQLLGYGWNNVEIPSGYEGKTVKIVFDVTENDAFEGIPVIYLTDGTNMIRQQLFSCKITLVIASFLIVFGILGMAMCVFMVAHGKAAFKMFCIMLFAFSIGVYTLCNGEIIGFFSTSLRAKVLLEYISLYFFVIPFVGCFSDWALDDKCPKSIRHLYFSWLSFLFLFFIFVNAMQVLNIVHFPRFVRVEHVLMVTSIIVVGILWRSQARRASGVRKELVIGFVLGILVSLFELVRYNVSKYYSGFSGNIYNSSMCYAALILVIALFADFTLRLRSQLYESAEQKLLEKLAYMDELTRLSNRRGCQEAMEELKTRRGIHAIISLDMNGLKTFNDYHGHDIGDRALIAFAGILKDAFEGENNTVGRMGGDEFIVILPNTTKSKVMDMVKSLNLLMKKYNKYSGVIQLSTALGVAYSKEADTIEDLVKLADKRMYENKRFMKSDQKTNSG